METIALTIDGKAVEVEEGTSVLDAARRIGSDIPTLCAHEDLPAFGACRLCVVEIEGMRGYPTSCTTPAQEGMVVRTQSERLTTLRNRIIELTLSGHPDACLRCNDREECEEQRPRPRKAAQSTRCGVCSNRDDCRLRVMTLEADSEELDLATLYRHDKLERDDPFISRDNNMCILCGRCWRVCEKIHLKPAISITHRGKWARIGVAFDASYVDSPCTFCGACVDICPTGALTDRYARWYGALQEEPLSICAICPEACWFRPTTSAGRMVGAKMTSFDREARLCAIGRFAHAQIVNSPKRLREPLLREGLREGGELIPVDWEHACRTIAQRLEEYAGGSFIVIAPETSTRENMHAYTKFATEVMGGRIARVAANGTFGDILDERIQEDLLAGRIRAAIVAGDYVDLELLGEIDYVVLSDALPSPTMQVADAVLPVAILTELAGSLRTWQGEVRTLTQAVRPPGRADPEWAIVSRIAQAMGAEGFDYQTVDDVTREIEDDPAPEQPAGSPRDHVLDLPTRFRGHLLADLAPALEAFGLPTTPKPPADEPHGGCRVVESREVAPDFHLLTVEAPVVARHAKAGQFIIVMAMETSERVPFTLVDWDAEAGTITFVVEELGRSSGEIVALQAGDTIAHVTGPLGLPLPIAPGGTVVLGGGCYGVGAIYPIARAYRASGSHVICVIEAASSFLLYMEDELRKVCHELIVMTKDGSKGEKGGVQDAFVKIARRETPIAGFVAIGCTFMMRTVARATESLGVPLQVALNPIMVDGTGMCGACRVSVSGDTRFACVDGPFFDGHAVDWGELASRRAAYARVEIEAMPQIARYQPRVKEGENGHVCISRE